MVTPFHDGRVDEDKLRELVEFHVSHGTDGLVPCGTTGESPTLTHEEHKRVVEIVVEQARGRIPVVAGTGSNSTAEAIDMTRHAAKAGAAGALLVTPYYNKPTQQGLYEHYRAIAHAVPDLPLIIYNIQAAPRSTWRPRLCAASPRSPTSSASRRPRAAWIRMTAVIPACGPEFTVLSGEMTTSRSADVGRRAWSHLGGRQLPGLRGRGRDARRAGRGLEARATCTLKLYPVCKAMFIETNPIPVKEAMAMLGMIRAEWRLPMCRWSRRTGRSSARRWSRPAS
jgi:4-hydroxy-tetrahydrodipicolinate synthase